MKRFFLIFSFSFIFTVNLFSYGGVLAGTKGGLKVYKTEYFDIIFPEECEQAARKIEAVCDSYYLEICRLFETEPYQRFPVTITKRVEQINAYFALVPYNRIVLFDTAVTEGINNNQKTLETIFYHELTHAVTMNIKAGFFKAMSFFADAFTPSQLTLTTFWFEGATVSTEGLERHDSVRGGRMNDPYSTQIVYQAKIDGVKPSWRDVTGARDTYPGGTDAYIWGGLFAKYLQDTYGFSKYAEFWYTAGRSLSLTFCAGVFKKTYGRNLTDVWNEFYEQLDPPQIKPLSQKDYLFSKQKKTLYSNLEVSKDKNTIVFMDTKSASLKKSEWDAQSLKYTKPKKIMAVRNVSKLSLSADGRYVLISRLVSKSSTRAELTLFDIKKGKKINIANESLRDGVILDAGENSVKIAAVKVAENPYSICFYTVELKGSEVKFDKKLVLKTDEIPFSLTCREGNLSYISKKGLRWSISEYDESSKSVTNIFVPDDEYPLNMRSLKYLGQKDGQNLYSFGYARIGRSGKMFGRAGFLNGNLFALGSEDYDGSIQEPAVIRGAGCEKLAFYGEHYEFDVLYELDINDIQIEFVPGLSETLIYGENGGPSVETSAFLTKEEPAGQAENGNQAETKILPEAEAYKPLSYAKNGVILPWGSINIYDFDFDVDAAPSYGASFITSNPWGDKITTVSGAFDIATLQGGFSEQMQSGHDSLSFVEQATVVFDKKGFMQASGTVDTAAVLYHGYVSSISAGLGAIGLYGREYVDKDEEKSGRTKDAKGYYAQAKALLTYSNVHKVAPGYYQYSGFKLTPFVWGASKDNDYRIQKDEQFNAGATLAIRLPGFVPLSLSATLFPKMDYFAEGSATAVLFNKEIHKGIPAVSLFAQRLSFMTSYSGQIKYKNSDNFDIQKVDSIARGLKKEDYKDTLAFTVELTLAPNTGFLASSECNFGLAASILYHFNGLNKEKWDWGINLNLAW
ncbi:MAG: hypothetical protein K6B73_03175 [Treponema sp.]|nr:hypothetical protein [Treponema sp.]